MKVDSKAQLTQAVATRAQPFKQLLSEARSDLKKDRLLAVPLKLSLRASTKVAAVTSSIVSAAHTTLSKARAHANAETQRLGLARTESLEVNRAQVQVRSERNEIVEERGAARIFEFITKEFSADPQPRPTQVETSVHNLQPLQPAAPRIEAAPEAKAAQAVALIERIEFFVRSQRPGLALTLNNSLGAHVEIERIGPREIALKLVGHKGPPTAEAVSRIRDELRARGLKVGALSVA